MLRVRPRAFKAPQEPKVLRVLRVLVARKVLWAYKVQLVR